VIAKRPVRRRERKGLPKGGKGGGSPTTDEMRVDRKRRFVEAIQAGYSPTEGARRAQMSRATAYVWREEDPEFAAAWDAAVEQGTDLLEDELYNRAMNGSDTSLIFALKARRRVKYGDLHAVRHVGHDGGAVKVEQTVEDNRPPLEELFLKHRAQIKKTADSE